MRHNGVNVWYAIIRDNDDADHGTGSHNKRDALRELKKLQKSGFPDAYIAIIDPRDDFCIDTIRV